MSVVKRAQWIGIGIVLGAIALVFAGTPPTKTGNLEVTGSATVSGSAWVAGGVYQAGNQVVSVVGSALFKSGPEIWLASCGSGQVWLYDGSGIGSGWNCGTAGGVTNTAGATAIPVTIDGSGDLGSSSISDDGSNVSTGEFVTVAQAGSGIAYDTLGITSNPHGTYDTTGGDRVAYAFRAINSSSVSTGSGAVENEGFYADITNGTSNRAIETAHGDVVLNNLGGTTYIGGAFTAASTATIDGEFYAQGSAVLNNSSGTTTIGGALQCNSTEIVNGTLTAQGSVVLNNSSGSTTIGGAVQFNNTINADTHKINNVVDPTSAQDAATKNYVDTAVTGTSTDLAVFTGSHTIGNYGGASACTSGSFVTAISASGATTCAAGGTLSGLTATHIPVATSGFSIGDSSLVITSTNLTVPTHVITSGSTPTLTGCGTFPTIVGTDTAGTLSPGSGVAGGVTCTVTFVTAYSNAPTCVVSDRGGADNVGTYTVSTTAIVYTLPTSTGSVDYICVGH